MGLLVMAIGMFCFVFSIIAVVSAVLFPTSSEPTKPVQSNQQKQPDPYTSPEDDMAMLLMHQEDDDGWL